MSILIRRALVSDADDIAGIHVSSWHDTYAGIIPDSYLKRVTVAHRANLWRASLAEPQPHVLLGTAGAQSLGFSSFHRARDVEDSENSGEIWAIYVHPQALGRGIGFALMTSSIAVLKAEGFTKVTLWVLEENLRARHFYENRYGFRRAASPSKFQNFGGKVLEEIKLVLDLDLAD